MNNSGINPDADFRIRAVVPDFDAYVDRYRRLSQETRSRWRHFEASYGPSPLERLDIFLPDAPGQDRPLHIFFHGGYWRAFDKSDYSFISQPIVAANAVSVIANYELMPTVSMKELLCQCRAAVRWAHEHAARLGASADRISLSGHSAGAHIAVLMGLTDWAPEGLPRDAIKSVMAISGIYDLAPVLQSFLREETGMTPQDVADFSPITCIEHLPSSAGNFVVAYGTAETEEFRRQSEVFAGALRKRQMKVDVLRVLEGNHMSVVLDLGDAESTLGQRHLSKLSAVD